MQGTNGDHQHGEAEGGRARLGGGTAPWRRLACVWALAALGAAMLVAAPGASAATDTIFGNATPATIDSGDGHSVELGVKFSSEVGGVVTGIRFYKATTNAGTHVGSLWSASGQLLSSATFSEETASGWQQVQFPAPVRIAANTTYVAAYFAPDGHYSDTSSGLSSAVSNPPLTALANSVSADGVYVYASSQTFPTDNFDATNYWVDVEFEPSTGASPPSAPTGVTASAGNGSATVQWSAPADNGSATTSYTITPYVGATAQTPTTVTGSPPEAAATVTGLANDTSYTFTVAATNAAGTGPASERSNAVTPESTAIAYPDLRLLMPTGDFSIVHKGSTRTLEFTHISSDLGAGPLEIRPSYDPQTGISQGYQDLFTSPSPGVWKFATKVPIVGPMIWTPPSDYNFPLDSFTLHEPASGGGVGKLVATSPKVLYCMTSDTFVGGVPNAPNENEYPASACVEPEGKLGLTVGWGDQYEATDGGEGIEITNLPNGTYWLQGIVDPYHYLEESNDANNITDTKLRIEGDTVTVLEQTHPEIPPPTVTLTSPSSGASLSGDVTLDASASGPSAITSVQFLLDGEPIGAPVTSPPYTLDWPVGSTAPGKHFLSAQATDAEGFAGTAGDVPVTVATKVGTVGVDTVVSETGTSTTTTPAFSTSEAGQVLLAFVDSDGPTKGAQTASVSGAGLSWSLVKRENTEEGDAEVWTATAMSSLLGATVTATASATGYPQTLTVVALSGAEGVGSSAGAAAASGAPTVSLTSTQTGAVALATGEDPEGATARTLGSGQELLSQELDTKAGDTFWTQYATSASSAAGQTLTLDDTAPTKDPWNVAAVEVLPSSTEGAHEPPTVSIVNPTPGETVSKTTQVTAQASDDVAIASVQFFLDGKALGTPVTQAPYAISWDTTTASNGGHTLTATATNTAGETGQSAPVEVTVQNPAQEETCFTADVTTSVEGGRKVTTQTFTTAEAGEQVFAFVSASGPAGAGEQTATVSGAGLHWRLLARANSQSGDAEIWTAEAHKQLKNKRVTSKLAHKGYQQELVINTMQGSRGAGATATAGAASGGPSVSLTTEGPGSLVYAVGSDPASATARVLGSNQTLMRQELDTAAGKTFWSQFTSAVTGPAGSSVTLDDTSPTADPWDMAAVEVLADEQ